jgi:hypothetical protein
MKREGDSPTLIIRNCRNVAMFSSGAMRNPVAPGLGGYVQVLGDSSGILAANLQTQGVFDPPNGEAMVREALTGKASVQVIWPDCVSVYKRDELDDAAMGLGAGE